MRWTCPKCGKKLNVSNEQLIANDGVIVCPQCLLQARQPVPKARVSSRDDKATTPPKRPKSNIDFGDEQPPKRQTPPPHKPRMKQASTSYRYTGMSGNNTTGAKKRNTGKKQTNKKKQNESMSALGCFGRTIIFTLVLFAAYVFLGLLIESFQ